MIERIGAAGTKGGLTPYNVAASHCSGGGTAMADRVYVITTAQPPATNPRPTPVRVTARRTASGPRHRLGTPGLRHRPRLAALELACRRSAPAGRPSGPTDQPSGEPAPQHGGRAAPDGGQAAQQSQLANQHHGQAALGPAIRQRVARSVARRLGGLQRSRSYRPRHHRPIPHQRRRAIETAVLVVLGVLLAGTWFAAAGATAFAQMISP
jgi:hypothetical protein